VWGLQVLWWLLFCGDLCVCVCPWLTHGPTGSVVAVIVCVCPRLTHGPTGSVVAVICVGRVCVCVCVLISGVTATRALACVHVCVHGCVCVRVGVWVLISGVTATRALACACVRVHQFLFGHTCSKTVAVGDVAVLC
jgi:hypothetical protein